MVDAIQSKQRDVTFDVMKGVGIILVLLGHIWELKGLEQFITSFHMPLFFVIAGYFSKSHSEVESICLVIKKYAIRLCVPYLFVMVTTVMWFCLMGYVKGDWNRTICEFISLFWAEPSGLPTPYGMVGIGVVWFLLALFWSKVYLLFFSRWEQLVLPLSIVFSIGALAIYRVFPYIPLCLLMGFTAFPFVTIGWWIRRNEVPLWLKILSAIAWVIEIFFARLDMYTYTWECYPLNLLGACGGTWVLYLLCRWMSSNVKNVTKIFAQLGICSLAIMCFHCFEMSSHLGNHLKAMLGLDFSTCGLYIWRYGLTILLSIVAIHTPKLKKMFV